MKFTTKIILFLFFFVLVSCEKNQYDKLLQSKRLSEVETEQVDILLRNLYQSFSYAKATEPNWELMNSLFIEKAQFVIEAPVGDSPRPQTIEEFISSWQNSIRNSNSPTVETTERIIETKSRKMGRLIYVDVVFQASKTNDSSPRKYGLDSLVLANVDGVWKILSFIIHYESKL